MNDDSDTYIVCGQCNVKVSGPSMVLVNAAFRGHEKEVHGYMTGQEWFARFRTELETMQPLMSPEGYEKFKKAALAVAERVSA